MIEMSLPFPLDEDGFLRRECPLCCREFKILLGREELQTFEQKSIGSFMLETQEEEQETGEGDAEAAVEFTCPYCGQRSAGGKWWTQEQVAYIGVVVQNNLARIVNEQFVRPMKKSLGRHRSGPVSFRFEGKELEQQEPWISPEANDMEVFDLPCCGRQIKVEDGWDSTVYCYFCGFPYATRSKAD